MMCWLAKECGTIQILIPGSYSISASKPYTDTIEFLCGMIYIQRGLPPCFSLFRALYSAILSFYKPVESGGERKGNGSQPSPPLLDGGGGVS
jgi:hypothetical protein